MINKKGDRTDLEHLDKGCCNLAPPDWKDLKEPLRPRARLQLTLHQLSLPSIFPRHCSASGEQNG